MLKKMEIIVSGRVQGIGYRAYALKQAEQHNIKGSVRNLHDGRVKVIAAGTEEDMKEFIKKLKKGPVFSLVRDIQVNDIESSKDYQDFRIEY